MNFPEFITGKAFPGEKNDICLVSYKNTFILNPPLVSICSPTESKRLQLWRYISVDRWMMPADLLKNKASVFIYDLVSINVCPWIRPFYSQCLLFLDKASVFIYDIISLNMCPWACLSLRIGTSIIVQAQTLKCFLLKWDNEQLVPSGFDGTKVLST